MPSLFPTPRYVHLQLTRVGTQQPRRRHGGGGGFPHRVPGEHGPQLKASVEGILDRHKARSQPKGIDPELVLRVELAPRSHVDPDEWDRSGFTVLGSRPDNVVLLFANDQELTGFRQRLTEYSRGIVAEPRTQHYKWLAAIERVSEWRSEDRRGRTLRDLDLSTLTEVTLDVELWNGGDQAKNSERLGALTQLLGTNSGRVLDRYSGQSAVLARVRLPSQAVDDLLTWDMVYMVERPPQPEFSVAQTSSLQISTFLPIQAPPDDAPGVCILDSGIAAGHGLLGPAVGDTTTVPLTLGTAGDVHGHGTMVAGIALYGDVQGSISQQSFQPQHWIFSVRVTNEQNEFDPVELIQRQMQDGIEDAIRNWRCRVFNLSLGDRWRPFDGARISAWAATLDELARRHNIVIVVSAGNYAFLPDDENAWPSNSHVGGYPDYLFRDDARIISPAEAANVLTVGSLARAGSPYQSERYPNDVNLRLVARADEPSPFTRRGPGIRNAIKPELCAIGGNTAIDERTNKVNVKDSGIACVSFNRSFASTGRLFEFDSGTSFAAPAVAYAAARVLDAFPQASANLVRALLTNSAQVPEAARKLLRDEERIRLVCGYGLPDLESAINSTDERVVLLAEDELGDDMFHIYELPLPDVFRNTSGSRSIGITLAFDPPTRYTRFDYLGTTMDFRLIRGLDIDQVTVAYARRQKGTDVEPAIPSKYICEIRPHVRDREGGTLQHAMHSLIHNPSAEYGDTYYVVVRCKRGWAGDEFYPQRYALVVTLAHARSGVPLYEAVRLRTRLPEQIRQRVRS